MTTRNRFRGWAWAMTLAATLATATVAHALPVVSGVPRACSTATLKGTYLYSLTGVLAGKPYAESGRETFDGAGGSVLTYTGSDGKTTTTTGRYELDANCDGQTHYPDDTNYRIYVSPDGSRATYTLVPSSKDADSAIAGSEIRVSR
ncbi:hypothetical protein KGQ64_09210 [bacterium]|nr:hypothetical protein [bacterium]